MELIGHIVRLQVQRSGIKVPSAPGAAYPESYEPEALLEVPAVELTAAGVIGLTADAGPEAQVERMLDVHHTRHPASRNSRGVNDVSVGFTTHYAAMRGRFGTHLADGIAGENILVAAGRRIEPADAARGLVIETRDGRQVVLERVVVAEPCVPFARFCLRLASADAPTELVKSSLQFLRRGTRGFYANYPGSAPAIVRLGDRVGLRG